MKFTEPEIYNNIYDKVQQTRKERNRFINEFSEPIKNELIKQDFKFDIKGRSKSIHSIWSKMKRQGVSFEEIYDLFAIRIIIDTDEENEKPMCWKAYSIITDFYHPNPDRLRDWISTPKATNHCIPPSWAPMENGWKFRSGQEEWMRSLKKVMLLTGNTKSHQQNLLSMNG